MTDMSEFVVAYHIEAERKVIFIKRILDIAESRKPIAEGYPLLTSRKPHRIAIQVCTTWQHYHNGNNPYTGSDANSTTPHAGHYIINTAY